MDSFELAIVTVVHTNLNIIVTCFSFVKPVTDSLRTGILAGDIPEHISTSVPRYPLKRLGNHSGGEPTGSRDVLTSEGSSMPREGRRSWSSEERMIIRQDLSVDVSYT